MARVAVVGVGAIGGVIAGLLTSAGHELLLCTRRPLADFSVEAPEGLIRVKAHNWTAPEQASRVDWVIVATKAYDSAGAKVWLDRLCDAMTQIAVVQNGVQHKENFAPEWNVLPVVIDVPTERRPDGSILQRSKAVMRVPESAEGRAFAELFAGTTAEVEQTADFVSAVWAKLCINAAGAVSALTGKPAGILRDALWGQVALDLVAECVAVGRAEGAVLDDATGERILAGYRAGFPDSVNSLLADRLAGRPMEIEARNGVIVRRGEKHGIATPLNRMTVALLNELARK